MDLKGKYVISSPFPPTLLHSSLISLTWYLSFSFWPYYYFTYSVIFTKSKVHINPEMLLLLTKWNRTWYDLVSLSKECVMMNNTGNSWVKSSWWLRKLSQVQWHPSQRWQHWVVEAGISEIKSLWVGATKISSKIKGHSIHQVICDLPFVLIKCTPLFSVCRSFFLVSIFHRPM